MELRKATVLELSAYGALRAFGLERQQDVIITKYHPHMNRIHVFDFIDEESYVSHPNGYVPYLRNLQNIDKEINDSEISEIPFVPMLLLKNLDSTHKLIKVTEDGFVTRNSGGYDCHHYFNLTDYDLLHLWRFNVRNINYIEIQ